MNVDFSRVKKSPSPRQPNPARSPRTARIEGDDMTDDHDEKCDHGKRPACCDVCAVIDNVREIRTMTDTTMHEAEWRMLFVEISELKAELARVTSERDDERSAGMNDWRTRCLKVEAERDAMRDMLQQCADSWRTAEGALGIAITNTLDSILRRALLESETR